MIKKYVYKVVDTTIVGYRSIGTIGYTTETILSYEIGVETIPRIGKLFCFKTFDQAKSYVDKLSGDLRILKCRASGHETPPKFVPSQVKDLNKFWLDSTLPFRCMWPTPKGSILCSKVIPLEEVYRKEKYK